MKERQGEFAPAREELLNDLARLKEVSHRNEELAKEIGRGTRSDDMILREMDSCVAEQSTIVDKFLSLADDVDAKKAFRTIVEGIEESSRQIEQCTSDSDISSLKERLLALIENWITALEEIITGVIAKAKE